MIFLFRCVGFSPNFLNQQGYSTCSNRGSLFFLTKAKMSTKRDINQFNHLPTHEFLTVNQSWVLPQLGAIFAELPTVRNDQGKISSSSTLARWKEQHFLVGPYEQGVQWIKGVLDWVTQSPRGKILGPAKQTGHRYHAGVPVVASWFKEHRGIPYSDWDLGDPRAQTIWGDLAAWGDPQVIEGVQAVELLGSDWLLSARENALEIKTGLKAGTLRDPKTCTNVYGPPPPLKDLPRLVQLCLTQLWVWHPSQVTTWTLGIPGSPDQLAQPLISEEPLKTGEGQLSSKDWWE